MVEEARLEESEGGLVPATDGWFVVNVRDGRWMTNETFGAACIFEGDNVSFDQVGFTLGVRRVAGSSFGGVKGRDQVPQFVDMYLAGDIEWTPSSRTSSRWTTSTAASS